MILFLKKKIYLIYCVFYLIFTLPFIFLIYPFKKIKFGCIKTKAVGDFATPMEIFNCEVKDGIYNKSNTLLIWCKTIQKTPNDFIFKKLLKNYFVFNKFLINPLIHFFKKNDYLTKKFIIPFRHVDNEYFYEIKKKPHLKKLSFNKIWQSRDIYNLLEKYPSQIEFTDNELNEGFKYIFSKNIQQSDKYVCFSSRVSEYRPSEKKYGISLRNASIFNQLKSINYLTNVKKYFAFRMGRGDKTDPLNNPNKKIVDYKFDSNNSDLLDAFLFSKCKFSISGGNGINNFPTIFRKPKLVLDFVNFRDLNTENPFMFPLMLPKLYKNKKDNRLIKFSDCIEKGIFQMNTTSQLNDNGYELIDNSENEILEVVKEMEDIVNENKENTVTNQTYFWDMIADNYIYTSKKFRIGNHFFKKYEYLFK
tara:strand:- start:513 stop:1769 length:1257 start_codon:yes stop_codon:yes gene_type:complete